jgi:hypothetical protein
MHLILIPFAVFIYFFNPSILDPQNIDWLLTGDLGQHFIGWHAFRHDASAWPLGWTTLLLNPVGLSISFTDSNPLISIALKPFSVFLPPYFQFIGLWYFTCITLVYYFSYVILKKIETNYFICMLGSTLLTLMPFFFARYGHDTLLAQWLILITFYVFVFEESRTTRYILFSAILTTTIAVQPYFYPMCGVFIGLSLLRDVLNDWKHPDAMVVSVRLRSVISTVARPLFMYCVATIVPLVALGLLAMHGGNGKFGYYTMDPLSWFNPRENNSLFLGSWEIGPGQYEGYQYLGLGNIILVVIAAGLAIFGKVRLKGPLSLALRWLVIGCAILYLVAISPTITAFGHVIIDIDPSVIPIAGSYIEKIFNIFRSSGRLFMPGSYLLIIVALAIVVTTNRRWIVPVLATLLVVQLADTWPLAASIRSETDCCSDGLVFRAVGQPDVWSSMLARSKRVVFAPESLSVLRDRFYYELFLLAAPKGVGLNLAYTAQGAIHPEQLKIIKNDLKEIKAGRFDDNQLYIIEATFFKKTLCPDGIPPKGFFVLDGKVVRPPMSFSVPHRVQQDLCIPG